MCFFFRKLHQAELTIHYFQTCKNIQYDYRKTKRAKMIPNKFMKHSLKRSAYQTLQNLQSTPLAPTG